MGPYKEAFNSEYVRSSQIWQQTSWADETCVEIKFVRAHISPQNNQRTMGKGP